MRTVPHLLATILPALLLTASVPASAATDPVGRWPLQPPPEVVAPFDAPESTWGPGHRGVDLLGTPGLTVRAALPGRVAFVGTIAGRGVVVVDHGPTRTTYEPVASGLAPGGRVAAGDPIGTLGLLGSHCFPRACLHWGWIRGRETYLDPLRLVGGGPVRLLPLAGLPASAPGSSGVGPPASPYAAWRPAVQQLAGWLAW